MMISIASFNISVTSLHHRRKKMMISMAGKRLDFTFQVAYPPSKEQLISEDSGADNLRLGEKLLSTAPFARDALMYDTMFEPLIHVRQCSTILQSVKPSLSPKHLSLSPIISPLHGTPADLDRAIQLVAEGVYGTVFVDPIHGRGDVRSFTQFHMQALRMACDSSNTLHVFDEMLPGLGKTGKLWSHSVFGIEPDAMLVCFGQEIGLNALLMKDFLVVHPYFQKRKNTMFTSCTDALTMINMASDPKHSDGVEKKQHYFVQSLKRALAGDTRVEEIRSFGLIFAIEFNSDARPIAGACKNEGLLLHESNKSNIIWMVIPNDVTGLQLDDATSILLKAMNNN